MPIPIPEAISDSGALAKSKASMSLPRYLILSMLAGAFVGIGIVVLASTAGPLLAAGNPSTKLVSGAVFGIALVLVVFAGAELFTGVVMVMLQGLMAKTVALADLLAVWAACLFGNLIGSIGIAALVHAGGTLQVSKVPGKPGPGAALIDSLVHGKMAASGSQLFWRAVLCNMLVCLAMWMAARTKSDTAKLVVLWWALMAFIVSGFEHSVANMTAFSLAIFQGSATVGDFMRNMAYTIPGNIVGGGLLIGVAYGYLGQKVGSPPVMARRSGNGKATEVSLIPETVA